MNGVSGCSTGGQSPPFPSSPRPHCLPDSLAASPAPWTLRRATSLGTCVVEPEAKGMVRKMSPGPRPHGLVDLRGHILSELKRMMSLKEVPHLGYGSTLLCHPPHHIAP